MQGIGAGKSLELVLRGAFSFCVAAIIVTTFGHTAVGAVVYENSSDYLGWRTFTLRPVGDEITLAGSEREIVELHIGVSMQGKAGTCDFQAWIYANDGPEGEPGTMLWGSELMEAVPLTGADEFVVFDVPNVTVPDTFTWTLQKSNPQPTTIGLPIYDPPSIGSSLPHSWVKHETAWQKLGPVSDPPYNYMARVIAVPEPGSILLLSLGGIALRRKRR